MKNKEYLNIYWAPLSDQENNDWSLMYSEPVTLFSYMSKNKIESKADKFFSCPAVKGLTQNTYIFTNTIESEYLYDFSDGKKIITPVSSKYLAYRNQRDASIKNGPIIMFNMSYVFFSDEPLLATFSSPYFSNCEYMKSGSFIPGEFDIGRWFRPYNCEMQLWSNSGSIKFNHDEPLLYVKFNTDKKIKMNRFDLNDKLKKIFTTNISTQQWYDTKKSLSTYYYLFNRAKMRDVILTEIKKNLVLEQL
jgi:hypothetical protein